MMNRYEHGGNIYKNKVQYDFSANINPFGMPKKVKKALKDNTDRFERYPDINSTELRNAISKKYNVSPENIVCGNGAIDVLYKTIGVIKPRKCLLAAPCFSEYEKALLENGSEIQYYFRRQEKEYRISEDYLAYMEDIDMLVLCEPNNPTGDLTDRELLGKILKKAAKKDIFVIIDECFMEFVNPKSKEIGDCLTDAHILIINAFTKIYAMAGLRLGFAMSGNAPLIKKISEYGAEWNVSVPAQIAGVQALMDTDYIISTRACIEKERMYLTQELRKIGIRVFDCEANFILIYESGSKQQGDIESDCVKPYERQEKTVSDYLMAKGIMIRDCSNFTGLEKGYYRIAVRTHEENEILIAALKEYRYTKV